MKRGWRLTFGIAVSGVYLVLASWGVNLMHTGKDAGICPIASAQGVVCQNASPGSSQKGPTMAVHLGMSQFFTAASVPTDQNSFVRMILLLVSVLGLASLLFYGLKPAFSLTAGNSDPPPVVGDSFLRWLALHEKRDMLILS